ncbi:MAG: GNVR domain-containing protein [Bryobacteraceae bacterium]
MEPSNYIGVSRRPLDVEDYIDIARRHWGWIAGPAFASLVIAVVVAFLWPNTYVSYAVMRITPAQIPERIVASNFNSQMAERLNSLRQDVTSRESLIAIIQKHNLYASELKKRPMEDVVEEMRNKIDINIATTGRGNQKMVGSAFHVSFAYHDRRHARNVVNELVSTFMDENLKMRRQQSRLTTNFLGDELKESKETLDRIEAELTEFKTRNIGRLPEETQNNVQAVHSLQVQMASVNDGIGRVQQDKLMLHTQLQNLKRQASAVVTTSEVAARPEQNDRLAQMSRLVVDLETQLAAMRENYREQHPDVRAAKARIEVVKRERDRMVAAEPKQDEGKARSVTDPNAVRMLGEIQSSINTVESQLQVKDLELEERSKAQTRLAEQLQQYQARLMARPANENQYVKLTRDYALAKAEYDRLTMQKGQSEMANKVEERSAGENLELLDPASYPIEPTSPNRVVIIALGICMGLTLGLFLAGAHEVKDSTLKNLKDVRAYSNLNVLSSIPLLENALVVRRKRRIVWVVWSAVVMLGVMAMSGVLYFYYFGEN